MESVATPETTIAVGSSSEVGCWKDILRSDDSGRMEALVELIRESVPSWHAKPAGVPLLNADARSVFDLKANRSKKIRNPEDKFMQDSFIPLFLISEKILE